MGHVKNETIQHCAHKLGNGWTLDSLHTQGILIHHSIATYAAIRGEHIIGWVAHYLIGISYAATLVIICGNAWVHSVINHSIFGLGLYLSGWALNHVYAL